MARRDRRTQENQQPVLRAAFLPDAEQRFVPQYADDDLYEEMAYEEENLYPDSVNDEDYEEENLYPDAFGEPVYTQQPVHRSRSTYVKYHSDGKNGLWTLIAFVCAACLAAMGYFVIQLHKPYDSFLEKVQEVTQNTFAQGIVVDNVHIGGLTREQAYQQLMASAGYDQQIQQINLDVQGIRLTSDNLIIRRNIDAKLDEAYAFGRQISKTIQLAGQVTPLEYKYLHRQDTKNNLVYLYTEVTYDPAQIRELVRYIASGINRDAVDAQVASFDFNNRYFTYTDDVVGLKVDEEALYAELISALDRKDYQASIPLSIQQIYPNITKAELMNSFALISRYTTETTSDQNRNNNVHLAAQAVMGRVVMPGEEFSFNQTTGQRTTEKGYLPAAAIAGGTTVDEVGGGVCQVSSTLFNAAVMADMTIVKRSPHTWPSNYVDKGRDATVNWPNLDFVFRNDRSTPIFIVAYYKNRQCTVEIYGASLGPGEGRDMASVVIDVTQPPSEPIRNYNPELPWGTEKEVKKARTGYVVETYKIYTRNGQEYKRERICTSTYRVIQQVIDYNY